MKLKENYANTGRLIKFILRRERVVSALWIAILASFCVAIAPGMAEMFDAPARQALAESMKNPAMVAMMGPVYGAEDFTNGAMYSNTMVIWVIITVAAMNIFLIVRHTRSDEEGNRAEVVRSLPVGRLAALNASMFSAAVVNAVLAALIAAGLTLVNVEGIGFAGSALLGLAIFSSGMFFAALAALFSQLSSSARGASALSFLCVGIFYMMRAAGDMDGNNEIVSLISPLGLILRSRFYTQNLVWPSLVLLAMTAAVSVAACLLNSVRDIGRGFFPARPGRPQASFLLKTSFGLSLRLTRNTVIAWFVIMFALGASYGSILGDIENFIAQSEFYQVIIGVHEDFSYDEMFVTMINSTMSVVALIPLLIIAFRPRAEERDERAENVLSRSVSRKKFLAGYAAIAFVCGALMQFATGAGLYLASAVVLDEPISFAFLMKAIFAYLPAVFAMVGLAVFLVGAAPKLCGAAWVFFGYVFFMVMLGRAMNLPAFADWIVPFAHIPQLPVDEIAFAPLLVLTLIAAALTAAGFVFYSRRDVAA